MRILLIIACTLIMTACTKENDTKPATTQSITYSIFCKSANFTFKYKGEDRAWHTESIKQQSYLKVLNVDTRDFDFASQVNTIELLPFDSVSLIATCGNKKVSFNYKYKNALANAQIQLSQLK